MSAARTPESLRLATCSALAETLGALVQQRIADLLHDRRWYRKQPNPIYWFDLRLEADRELRALLRLRGQARRLIEAKPDPMLLAKAAAWTESELRLAAGDR